MDMDLIEIITVLAILFALLIGLQVSEPLDKTHQTEIGNLGCISG